MNRYKICAVMVTVIFAVGGLYGAAPGQSIDLQALFKFAAAAQKKPAGSAAAAEPAASKSLQPKPMPAPVRDAYDNDMIRALGARDFSAACRIFIMSGLQGQDFWLLHPLLLQTALQALMGTKDLDGWSGLYKPLDVRPVVVEQHISAMGFFIDLAKSLMNCLDCPSSADRYNAACTATKNLVASYSARTNRNIFGVLGDAHGSQLRELLMQLQEKIRFAMPPVSVMPIPMIHPCVPPGAFFPAPFFYPPQSGELIAAALPPSCGTLPAAVEAPVVQMIKSADCAAASLDPDHAQAGEIEEGLIFGDCPEAVPLAVREQDKVAVEVARPQVEIATAELADQLAQTHLDERLATQQEPPVITEQRDITGKRSSNQQKSRQSIERDKRAAQSAADKKKAQDLRARRESEAKLRAEKLAAAKKLEEARAQQLKEAQEKQAAEEQAAREALAKLRAAQEAAAQRQAQEEAEQAEKDQKAAVEKKREKNSARNARKKANRAARKLEGVERVMLAQETEPLVRGEVMDQAAAELVGQELVAAIPQIQEVEAQAAAQPTSETSACHHSQVDLSDPRNNTKEVESGIAKGVALKSAQVIDTVMQTRLQDCKKMIKEGNVDGLAQQLAAYQEPGAQILKPGLRFMRTLIAYAIENAESIEVWAVLTDIIESLDFEYKVDNVPEHLGILLLTRKRVPLRCKKFKLFCEHRSINNQQLTAEPLFSAVAKCPEEGLRQQLKGILHSKVKANLLPPVEFLGDIDSKLAAAQAAGRAVPVAAGAPVQGPRPDVIHLFKPVIDEIDKVRLVSVLNAIKNIRPDTEQKVFQMAIVTLCTIKNVNMKFLYENNNLSLIEHIILMGYNVPALFLNNELKLIIQAIVCMKKFILPDTAICDRATFITKLRDAGIDHDLALCKHQITGEDCFDHQYCKCLKK